MSGADVAQSRLTIRPIGLRAANAFVGIEHRHNPPVRGHKFSQSVVDDRGQLRGVGIAGRPVSRILDTGTALEILRVCTDGTPNACSALYGAAARAGVALGYRREDIFTYTREDEPGTSLLAAGFVRVAYVDPREWDRPSRRREQTSEVIGKWRWHAAARGDQP